MVWTMKIRWLRAIRFFPFKVSAAMSAAVLLFALTGPMTVRAGDSCVDCHGNPNFIVTNKKLFDYFQEWDKSIHRQEDITCSDCHGGNPEVSSKKKAHGGKGGRLRMQNAVNFQNIPSTCGQCHDDIYDGYRLSNHFKHLKIKKQVKQGPNCVTCHGSLNAVALNVNTVKQTCTLCHNTETGNSAWIPKKAEWLLNKYLSIHRLFRFVSIRADDEQTRQFVKDISDNIQALAEDWHKFDLASFEGKTKALLDLLKTKRNEIRMRQREQRRN